MLLAQSTTQVVVRVGPEAKLNVNSVPLRFALPSLQPVSVVVEAWARPLPGQRVRLVAIPDHGAIPASALQWTGEKIGARGGGAAAGCTSGTLKQSRSLADNWNAPGTLTCRFTFSLADAEHLAPGVYAGGLRLDLRFE